VNTSHLLSVIAFVCALVLGGCASASRRSAVCLSHKCSAQHPDTTISALCAAIQSAELGNQSARFKLRDSTQLSGHAHLSSCTERIRLGHRRVSLADVTQLELRISSGRLPVVGALLGAMGGIASGYGLAFFVGADVFPDTLGKMALFGAIVGSLADAISQDKGAWQTVWKE
jgi:hypothetical protein